MHVSAMRAAERGQIIAQPCGACLFAEALASRAPLGNSNRQAEPAPRHVTSVHTAARTMEEPQYTERPPIGFSETALAHCRPQPAIPAVLSMLLLVLYPLISNAMAGSGWLPLLVAAGTLVSCGLAIAAGFCSFFPPLIWLGLAGWCSTLPGFAALPGYNTVVLMLGAVCAVAMLGVQAQRVRSGQFVPTVRVYPDTE